MKKSKKKPEIKKAPEVNNLETPFAENIKMTAIESSNIQEMGYDEKTKTLQLNFISGGNYQYNPIPLPYWKAMQIADSKGSFFFKHIKNKPGFNSRRIS